MRQTNELEHGCPVMRAEASCTRASKSKPVVSVLGQEVSCWHPQLNLEVLSSSCRSRCRPGSIPVACNSCLDAKPSGLSAASHAAPQVCTKILVCCFGGLFCGTHNYPQMARRSCRNCGEAQQSALGGEHLRHLTPWVVSSHLLQFACPGCLTAPLFLSTWEGPTMPDCCPVVSSPCNYVDEHLHNV